MEVYKYGNDQASIVLIQMVGEHDLSIIKQEIVEIQKLTEMKFQFIAIKVNSWNHDLSRGMRVQYLEVKALVMVQNIL